MTFLGTVCGKIQTRRIKNGQSHNLMLVKNKRNFMTGKAEADVIFNFGTIRSYQLTERAAAMWRKINLVLDTLAADCRIYRNDAERAKSKFAEVLGSYVPGPAAPAPAAKPKKFLTAEERLRERFGDVL
jgi:hypothetical protein